MSQCLLDSYQELVSSPTPAPIQDHDDDGLSTGCSMMMMVVMTLMTTMMEFEVIIMITMQRLGLGRKLSVFLPRSSLQVEEGEETRPNKHHRRHHF